MALFVRKEYRHRMSRVIKKSMQQCSYPSSNLMSFQAFQTHSAVLSQVNAGHHSLPPEGVILTPRNTTDSHPSPYSSLTSRSTSETHNLNRRFNLTHKHCLALTAAHQMSFLFWLTVPHYNCAESFLLTPNISNGFEKLSFSCHVSTFIWLLSSPGSPVSLDHSTE